VATRFRAAVRRKMQEATPASEAGAALMNSTQDLNSTNLRHHIMQITITGKQMDLTPAIEEYVRKKVDKLPRYFDRIQQVDVTITKEAKDYRVEIRTDVEHHADFIARSDHDDLYACVDISVDRSIRQLTDHKNKLRNHQHTNGQSEKGA